MNWVSGPNTKTMKKVFPILPYLEDDDLILMVDDDLIVPKDLIAVRLKEFHDHGDAYPISGGSNAKWHLNKPLFHTKYNNLTTTSIFQKKMLANYDKILCDDLIKTYNDDFLYTMLIMANGYGIIPTKLLSAKPGTSLRSMKFQGEVSSMGANHQYKPDDVALRLFEMRFNEVMPYSFKDALTKFVIWDSENLAGDNGEYLYRRVNELYPHIKMTFLLSPKSRDWKRLKDDGFNLRSFNDGEMNMLMSEATFILFSKDIGNDTKARKCMGKYKSKCIFLQHGTINRVYDCGFYLRGCINKCAKYICCSSKDEASIIEDWSRKGI